MIAGVGNMIQVIEERHIDAPPDAVWPLVADPDLLAEWFCFADRIEDRGGERWRLHGRWGSKRSEVDVRLTEVRPARRLAWTHERERLGAEPASRFSADTQFAVELDPEAGATRVRLVSRQQPASFLRGVVMRLLGRRRLRSTMRASLSRLSEVVQSGKGSAA